MKELDEKIFLACLDALDAGEDPAQIVGRYPEQADALRELLELDRGLGTLPMRPPAGAEARSEALFLAQADAMRRTVAPARPRRWWPRPLLTALAAVIIVLSLSLGALQASAQALPGDLLYSVKRFNESARLRLANDPQTRLELEESIEAERIREVLALLRLGRDESVQCRGTIELMARDHLEIYGLRVELTEETVIEGELALEAEALVSGYTQKGRYYAERITIVSAAGAAGDQPAAAPTATATATATETATPTDTVTATPSPSPTTTEEPTPTLQATGPPSPAPFSTATPDDDDCDSSGPGNNCDDDDDCDSSGPGNHCDDDDDDDDDCDSSGSGNHCDDDDDDDDCDSSGPGNHCDDDDDDDDDCDSSGSGNNCDDDDDDDDCDSSGPGNHCDEDDDDDDSGSSGSGSGNSGSGHSGSGGGGDP